MTPKTTIPCDCGSDNARWHGERTGLRSYRCDNCERIHVALQFLRSDYVQGNKHRLGALGSQDIDSAIAALTQEMP